MMMTALTARKMKIRRISWMLALILLVPFSLAVRIENTMLYSSGLNSNISIGSQGWNVSNLIVDTNFIYVENLTSSHSGEADNSPITFNFTETNAFYYGTDAPYWTSASYFKRIFYNNMSSLVGSLSFPVWMCDIREVKYNGNSTTYSCSSNYLTLSGKTLQQGSNTILIDYNITLTNCTNGTALNFRAYDEDTFGILPAVDFDVVVTYWNNKEVSTENLSFSTQQLHGAVNKSPEGICITPTYGNVSADVYIKYKANNSFTHRYFLNNYTLTSTPYNITLYNFEASTGVSELRLTVRNSDDYEYYPNIYVSLLRYYPSQNTWKVVQMDRTGDYGQAFFHVLEQTTDYELKFQDYEGHVLKVTQPMKFACDSGVCDLTVLLSAYTPTTIVGNLSISYTYLNASKQFKLTWTNLNNEISHIIWKVSKETMSGTTYICSNEYYSAGGTAYCNVTGYTGDIFIYIEGDGHVFYSEFYHISEGGGLSQYLPVGEQVFIAAFFLVVVIGAGAFSLTAGVVLTIFGIIVVSLLGIFPPLTLTFTIIASILGIATLLVVRNK